eukprot:5068942-Amphidinium_carterae.1
MLNAALKLEAQLPLRLMSAAGLLQGIACNLGFEPTQTLLPYPTGQVLDDKTSEVFPPGKVQIARQKEMEDLLRHGLLQRVE